MKRQIIKLLFKLNDIHQGKLITNDINKYVDKIVEKASLVTIYNGSNLKGFIAYYDNDKMNQTAYLTMIAIEPYSQGLGYGKNLIDFSVKNLKRQGFKMYKLEVLKNNTKALTMYQKYGFVIEEDRSDFWLMNLELNKK
jgi:ribosomal-protein-alanine N-acetyltransferase